MTDRGCFGLPSTFNPSSSVCTRCDARPDCRGKSIGVLERIGSHVAVDKLLHSLRLSLVVDPMPRGVDGLTDEQARTVASAPTKIAKRLGNLLRDQFDSYALHELREGRNPFPIKGAKHLHLVGDMLLAGGFTKKSLKEACMDRFAWGAPAAFSTVTQTVALLRGLGLLCETTNEFTIKQRIQ